MVVFQSSLGRRALSTVVVLLVVVQGVLSQERTRTEIETELGNRLLSGYSSGALPVPEGGLQVEVQVALGQFVAINTALETVEFQGWWRLYWNDPRLSWDPEVEGVGAISFKTSQVWIPDVTVYEQIQDAVSPSLVTVSPNGNCYTSIPRRTKIGCPMMISSFPYDRQRCNFTIGSWSYDGTRLDVVPKKQDTSALLMDGDIPDRLPFDLEPYKGFQEFWLAAVKTIWQNTYYNCCPEPYPVLLVEFDLHRSTQTYLSGMVVPLILVTCVGFFSLFMPAPPSGARPALSVTVMLTTATVYFVASRSTPQSNQSTSIGRIYIYSLASSFLLVFLSIITTALNLIQNEDKAQAKHLADFFEKFDENNDGTLDKGELRYALASLGLNDRESDKVMKFFITDDDPTINKEQWKAFGAMTQKTDDDAVYHNGLVRAMVHKAIELKIKSHGTGLGKEHPFHRAASSAEEGFERKRSAEAVAARAADAAAKADVKQRGTEPQASVNSLAPSNMEMRTIPPMSQVSSTVAPQLAFSNIDPSQPWHSTDPAGYPMGYSIPSFSPNGQQWAQGMRFGTPAQVQWASGMAFGSAEDQGTANGGKTEWKEAGGRSILDASGLPIKAPSGNPSFNKVAKKISRLLNSEVSEIAGPPRVGRELSAWIDKWARRLMPLGFFIFLVCEFTGVISGGNALGELNFHKDSEGNAKTRIEYFDYRSNGRDGEMICFTNFPTTRLAENQFDVSEKSCGITR